MIRLHVHVLLLLCLLLLLHLVLAPHLHSGSLPPLHMRLSHPYILTVHNSRCAGVLLPVCKSTSYSLGIGREGLTGRRSTKGGVSGPAEDLRPVREVEAGVNFRPAGRVRGQVAGSLPGRQPGTGTRTSKGSVVTPSLHPEVPDSLFVSPIDGLDEGVWNHTIGDLGAKG